MSGSRSVTSSSFWRAVPKPVKSRIIGVVAKDAMRKAVSEMRGKSVDEADRILGK